MQATQKDAPPSSISSNFEQSESFKSEWKLSLSEKLSSESTLPPGNTYKSPNAVLLERSTSKTSITLLFCLNNRTVAAGIKLII